MAYRDPVDAARHQVELALERAAEREEQITGQLTEQLPQSLGRQLRRARAAAMKEPQDLEGLRAREQALNAYSDVLDEVLKRAPKIEKRYNRLPRIFPDRIRPKHGYLFPDVYSPVAEGVRNDVHAIIRRHDADATIYDLGKRYFDQQADPYLVDACFRSDGAPVRIHVVPSAHHTNNASTGSFVRVGYSMLTLLRRSIPDVKLDPQHWGHKLLKLLSMQDDAIVGRPRIDEMFIIDALPEDATRVLTEEVCEGLLALAHIAVPTLEIERGLARIEWTQGFGQGHSVDAACKVLAGLRRVAPTPLFVRR